MTSKFEVNQNDEVNQLTETSGNMCANKQDEAALAIIRPLQDATLLDNSGYVDAGKLTYRLQRGAHGGNSVFFNRNGADFRYSLTDGVTGSMYLAFDPLTPMKEVFQGKKSLGESDLDIHYIGQVVIEKDVRVLLVKHLVRSTPLTINHVTTGTRAVTQLLAEKARAAGLDGILFTSNVTGEDCLVLWHDDVAGTGMAVTRSQTRLTDFEYNGQEAADILVYSLGIPVDE
ncbi:RES family NAD+ phosphorylase [Serratia sp. S4]|uniref:RES family NAD+ phosphorylase n=1 Tax=Serratia sp. S4 TaxID=768491 RepID=UPI00037D583A|nr:RES family NAD+ phosphorylase [Serratia sp. S4]